MPLLYEWSMEDGAPQRARLYAVGNRLLLKLGNGNNAPIALKGDVVQYAADKIKVAVSQLPPAFVAALKGSGEFATLCRGPRRAVHAFCRFSHARTHHTFW